jgi:hypothetical protein
LRGRSGWAVDGREVEPPKTTQLFRYGESCSATGREDFLVRALGFGFRSLFSKSIAKQVKLGTLAALLTL